MMDNRMGTETGTTMPENVEYDDKVLKKIIGSAVEQVQGVKLGGGLGDTFKSKDDLTKGISVKSKDNHARVDIKVESMEGVNIPNMVNEITEKVKETLKQDTGLIADEVNVKVADMVSEEKI